MKEILYIYTAIDLIGSPSPSVLGNTEPSYQLTKKCMHAVSPPQVRNGDDANDNELNWE